MVEAKPTNKKLQLIDRRVSNRINQWTKRETRFSDELKPSLDRPLKKREPHFRAIPPKPNQKGIK